MRELREVLDGGERLRGRVGLAQIDRILGGVQSGRFSGGGLHGNDALVVLGDDGRRLPDEVLGANPDQRAGDVLLFTIGGCHVLATSVEEERLAIMYRSYFL